MAYSRYLGYPGIALIILLIPITILIRLRKKYNNNRHEWYTHRIKTGFLSSDFRRPLYFWEFLRTYKKYLLVICSSLINTQAGVKLLITSIVYQKK